MNADLVVHEAYDASQKMHRYANKYRFAMNADNSDAEVDVQFQAMEEICRGLI